MKKISGDLAFMPLPDLMQWAEMHQKSGTLHFIQKDKDRLLYFDQGKIIFATSRTAGERLGEFLLKSAHLDKKQLQTALQKSKKLKIPFTSYLISEKIIQKDGLNEIILKYAEAIVVDAMDWQDGSFEFSETLPKEIINGPVKLEIMPLLFESFRKIDESQKNHQPDVQKILKNIADRINNGDMDIPPIPDILNRLETAIRIDAPIRDIAAIIVTDQVLTSSILKVANSPIFRQSTKITSLSQAAVQLGIKAIKNMVTAHVLSGISAKDPDRVRKVMQHSLLCAFAARMIAENIRENSEEAFICGLLHDIGKTVLINLLSGSGLSADQSDRVLSKYHSIVGYAIAKKWHLSDAVGCVTRFHHSPQKSERHQKLVELVAIADRIANNPPDVLPDTAALKQIDFVKAGLPAVISKINKNRDRIVALI